MDGDILLRLEKGYKRSSDCILHQECLDALQSLRHEELSQEVVDYLCEKAVSQKHIWELRHEPLRILLLNESARSFPLKEYFFEAQKKSRRNGLRIFYIRGYAMYASEEEMESVMQKFIAAIEKPANDHIDYGYMLSPSALPYLLKTYGYSCFLKALRIADEQYRQRYPTLRDTFVINNEIQYERLVDDDKLALRYRKYLEEAEQ